jgi:lipopolysaccharide export system permease protein
MLSERQLTKAIDSLEKSLNTFEKRSRNDIGVYLAFMKYLDTGWTKVTIPDTLGKISHFRDILPDSTKVFVTDQALSYANSIKSSMEGSAIEYDIRRKELRLHLIEWHNKFTMSLAVLVLFLIGAPLGSIVRKGGIGTPVVFAVVFFVIFFLLNNFGRKFVKEDVLQPVAGMWLATMVLVPIGFFLTYKALHDSQLFNKEVYSRIYRQVAAFLKRISGIGRKREVADIIPTSSTEEIRVNTDITEK